MTLPHAVIVDIDGTLALRRRGPGERSPFDWGRVGEDEPNPPMIELVQAIRDGRPAWRILLVSGRDEVCRDRTQMWLDAQHVPFDHLLMRRHKDNRPDVRVKEEIYRRDIAPGYAVKWVIDDRATVVAMWRAIGLHVFALEDGTVDR